MSPGAAFASRGDLLRSAETIVRVPDVPSRLVLALRDLGPGTQDYGLGIRDSGLAISD
jgi:hypothetical protein